MTHKVDAVTVNINYKLGFLGFSSVEELCDVDEGVYANNSIRDMVAALDWVQDNIAEFGGDPKSVTLLGASAGAASVLALVSFSLGNNKFHAGIALSLAPEMRFTHEQGNNVQRNFLENAGCSQDTIAERKRCLLNLPANKFIVELGVRDTSQTAYFKFPISQGPDGEHLGHIMVDPTVVPVSPRNLKNAAFQPSTPLPIILSNCNEETYNYWYLSGTGQKVYPIHLRLS